jgi:hypothetical protein
MSVKRGIEVSIGGQVLSRQRQHHRTATPAASKAARQACSLRSKLQLAFAGLLEGSLNTGKPP